MNDLEVFMLVAGMVALFGVVGGIASLLSTHPSTEERIARLEAMARGGTSTR